MFKKLLSHSFLYSVVPQLPRLLSLALMPVLTRYLTEKDYGIYGVITAYIFFIAALKDLGFSVVFVNTFYKHTKRWPLIWRLLHGHLIIWSFFYAIIYLVVLYIAMPQGEMHNYFLIASLGIFQLFVFDNTTTLGSYYYRFKQKPLYIAIVAVVTGVISIGTIYICVVHFKMGYIGWFIAMFVTGFVNFLFFINPVYFILELWPVVKWRKKFINPYLKVSLPMIPHNYSAYLQNSSDRVVLDWYKTDVNAIGYYNFAYQFGSLFEVIGNAVGMAVGPYYTKMYTDNTNKSLLDEKHFTFFMMGSFLIATFFVSLWMREIFSVLVNNDQLKLSYDIGILILMGYAYRPMYWSAGIKLTTHGKTNILWRISAVGGIINVILNLIFVPRFGIYAAAVSTLIGLLYIGFSGYYFKIYKNLNPPEYDHYPTLWMIVIVVTTAAVYFLRDVGIVYKIGITAMVAVFYFRLVIKNFRLLNAINV